ncbi:uncharacterized protein [Sinocyclocheilus grahami]|uniref:uncharacterized protein n=1 Tax=Sinocyclocheilus grahami TaxID=75366 RepID=UPI0007ACD8E5|nr:PREDICTED: uncharacterized protein LOC107566283 [Sinocyclocheilus grahami]
MLVNEGWFEVLRIFVVGLLGLQSIRWSGYPAVLTCVLVLTLSFLVFEIVVGQICRSLLIAADTFHTLYVFINLALSAIKHHSSSPCSPDTSTTAGPSRPNISASGGPSPLYAEDYRRMRLKPFGILISAHGIALMASQCVSISLEILTHLVQPEPIQHSLRSIVVGGTSLIFNIRVWAWRRSSSGIEEAADGISKSLIQLHILWLLYFIMIGKVKHLQQNGCEDLDDHWVVGSALQDDTLMFCNPEASSVLDPDPGCQDGSAEFPNHSISDPVQSGRAQTPTPRIAGRSQEIIQHSEQLPEEARHSTCTEPSVFGFLDGSSLQKSPLKARAIAEAPAANQLM